MEAWGHRASALIVVLSEIKSWSTGHCGTPEMSETVSHWLDFYSRHDLFAVI